MGYKVACFGDTHFPFHCQKSLSAAIDFTKKFRPDIIIQMGDLNDQYAQSRFPKRIRMTAEDEIKKARVLGEMFWYKIRKDNPKAKLFQLKGNHDIRREKMILEKCPEIYGLVDFKSFYEFQGVETIDDCREELVIENILYTHGHKTKIGDHLKDFQYQYNVVCGHLHRAGIHFERVGKSGKTVWEANAGYLADPFHPELIYRPMKKFFTWTKGILLVNEFPVFRSFDFG